MQRVKAKEPSQLPTTAWSMQLLCLTRAGPLFTWDNQKGQSLSWTLRHSSFWTLSRCVPDHVQQSSSPGHANAATDAVLLVTFCCAIYRSCFLYHIAKLGVLAEPRQHWRRSLKIAWCLSHHKASTLTPQKGCELLPWMLLCLSDIRAGHTVMLLCVQVPGASRIVSMTLNRKGTRLLVNCYDRAVRLFEICHPGRRRRSYTAADLKTRLASAKVCISFCACCWSQGAQPGYQQM